MAYPTGSRLRSTRCHSSTRHRRETRFTNDYDPDARSRRSSVPPARDACGVAKADHREPGRFDVSGAAQAMPALDTTGSGTSKPGDQQPRGIPPSGSSARPDPDGDRFGQDVHRCERRVPPDRHAEPSESSSLWIARRLATIELEFDKFDIPDTQRNFPAEYNIQHLTRTSSTHLTGVHLDHPAGLLDSDGGPRTRPRAMTSTPPMNFPHRAGRSRPTSPSYRQMIRRNRGR